MMRVWAFLLMVALAAAGVAQHAAARLCCMADMQHRCCHPVSWIHADCCSFGTDSSALSAEVRRNPGDSAGVLMQLALAPSAPESLMGLAKAPLQTPGLHAPPIVLRI
jgi:hypothetical protein